MRLHHIWIALTVAGVVLGTAALAPAADVDVNKLANELSGAAPAAQRSGEQLVAAYAAVLDSILPKMGKPGSGRKDAYEKIEKIALHASRPGAEAERAACSKAIAAKLTPGMPSLASLWMLRQLERIGRAEAVAAVTAMLADKNAHVRDAARRALQKNSSPQANAALTAALASAKTSAARAAMLNALGDRSDPANLSCLITNAGSDNDAVRTAAVIGLARLGDKSAMPAIEAAMTKGAGSVKAIAIDACLRLAEALSAKGKADRAVALGTYKKLLSAKGHLRCAAIVGLGRAGSASELPAIFDALASEDVKVRGAGVEALCLIQNIHVQPAIIARCASAELREKEALLQVLTRRGDKSAVATFVASAQDADEGVRTAALAGLAQLGGADSVGVLLKAAATEGVPQATARQGLQLLPGADVDKALIAAIDGGETAIRIEAILALSTRRTPKAAARLLKAVKDADASVRVEAVKALGAGAPAATVPALTAVLVKTEEEDLRNQAVLALANIARRSGDVDKCTTPVLAALSGAKGPAKFALLKTLGMICGPKALEALESAANAKDEETRDAAVRALASWPNISAAATLLTLAKTTATDTHKVLAIRGYIRLCRAKSNRKAAETTKMLIAGLDAATRPQEKKQAISALGGVSHITSLKAVTPYMDDPALKQEAASAAVRICKSLRKPHAQAIKDAMEKVIKVSRSARTREDAKKYLAQAQAWLQK